MPDQVRHDAWERTVSGEERTVMQDHTVTVDTASSPTALNFAETFNVAVPFIDRHLEEGRADKVAVRTTDGAAETYGDLAANVNRAGNALKGLGIEPRARVLMMIKDCPAFFHVFWGAIKAGIQPVPINTLLKAKDYAFMISDSQCAAVIYSPEFAGEVEAALEQASCRPAHALRTEGDGETFAALMAGADETLAPAPAHANDDCFWLYSSGTTGAPKGTVHAHRDMVVTSQHYGVETLGCRENDTCFSAAKLFFAYGLGNAMTFPLWVGASSVLFPGRPTPEVMFDTIRDFQPTIYYGVPTLYAAQLKYMAENTPDTASLRVCVSAGEALPADIYTRWKENTGTDILDGIGSTEALHIFISNKPGDIHPGTSGRPVSGYTARVVGENGEDVADGESGTLWIKGASNAKYYWNNPDKTAATMIDGWLVTGDTYVRDEQGLFYYCGRSDDMMKVGGIWCSPFEIESCLIGHEKVLEAAVVGRADDEGLEKPEAWVVLNDASDATDATRDELTAHCKANLAGYKYPRWFNFVDELPKTATGKIQRYKLRE
jgi:benzoate-CoA ligase family protein